MQIRDLKSFTSTLANFGGDLGQVYENLRDMAQQLVGHDLFTLMTVDPDTGEAARIYSNRPDAYPVFGKKKANVSRWSKQVIDEHQTFVANDIDAIAEVFDDYHLIKSLGCESVINIPIIIAGQVIGTINCLAAAGHYTSQRVIASEELKLPGAACFLLQMSNIRIGGR